MWLNSDERAPFVQLLEENGIVRGYECQFRCKDGTPLWVSLSSRKVCGPDGKTLHYEGFIEDITDRKRAEEALSEAADQVRIRERQLSTIYSGVSDALFLLSVEPEARYRFVTVNEAFLAMTGLVPEQVVGKLVHHIIPEPLVVVSPRQIRSGDPRKDHHSMGGDHNLSYRDAMRRGHRHPHVQRDRSLHPPGWDGTEPERHETRGGGKGASRKAAATSPRNWRRWACSREASRTISTI